MSLLEMIPTPAPLPVNTEQEQHHADKNYKAVVAAAVEACADDTQGQTCYICTEAVHWKTKEGLVRGCACRGTSGFAHVSCLAEQANILMEEAEDNDLDPKALNERWARWRACSLCKQRYHGVVQCALGSACWKTYVGRPEASKPRGMALSVLGNGLYATGNYEQALFVEEARLSMVQRLGASEQSILAVKGNLAASYLQLGRLDEALLMRQDVYSGFLKLCGEEHFDTLREVNNNAAILRDLEHFEEAKTLLLSTLPVARRVLGDNDELTLKIRNNYAMALYSATGATLDDLREAVETLEETERPARRVFGGSHPTTVAIERNLRDSRAALRAREAPPDELDEMDDA